MLSTHILAQSHRAHLENKEQINATFKQTNQLLNQQQQQNEFQKRESERKLKE